MQPHRRDRNFLGVIETLVSALKSDRTIMLTAGDRQELESLAQDLQPAPAAGHRAESRCALPHGQVPERGPGRLNFYRRIYAMATSPHRLTPVQVKVMRFLCHKWQAYVSAGSSITLNYPAQKDQDSQFIAPLTRRLPELKPQFLRPEC